jgi:hypothetical protein
LAKEFGFDQTPDQAPAVAAEVAIEMPNELSAEELAQIAESVTSQTQDDSIS